VPATPSLLVVIAAYNESAAIGAVVQAIVERGYGVVVVDDGSSDDTVDVARHAGATVIQHPINLGQGAALQTGIEFGRRRDYVRLATFDADGQHDPDDIAVMLERMERQRLDFVLGSRFIGATVGMSMSRRILLKLAVLFTRLTSRMRLTDAHNGLRLMSAKGAACIDLRQNRMAHASEILDQIGASGLPYGECPVTIRYTEYSKAKGQSGFNALNIVLDLLFQRMRK
jgi:polyprenyl-phospho-N-acetylgalactosaminyl synthase